MSLEVLYQDQHYIAVHKPAGLLVHRTELDPQATEAAVQILRDQINSPVYPVHRLDRPTSGVLVFALNSLSANRLAVEFSNKTVEKKYLAIVRGQFEKEILLDYPLKQELGDFEELKSQEAQTYFKPLDSIELEVSVDRYPTSRYSLIQAVPRTGRTHQIRKHLKHLNHPIIGDVNHGNGKHNRFFADNLNIKRMLLACTEICFKHPFTNQDIKIQTTLCADFKLAISKLGFSYDS